jgi:diguanylate cyclase (GGDEF)-like protein/PAS domain S-box-containing protein
MKPFARLFPSPAPDLRPYLAASPIGLWRIAVAFLLVALFGGFYWWQLLAQQRDQLAFAENQARLRTTQISTTMASHVGTLVAGLEYLAHSLAMKYAVEPPQFFPIGVRTALATYPTGSIGQIAVANAAGQVVYSSLDNNLKSQANPVSIADREHFKVHTQRPEPALFISRPVLGRVSGKWTVQFSYPVMRDGQFDGVVVLSVAPDYLSGHFSEVSSGGNDVTLLVRDDGAYLARSDRQEAVLNLSVPPDREFVRHPDRMQGQYQVKSPIDGVERLYAWHRLRNYPLVVSVGLDHAQALAATKSSIQTSLRRNAAGTLIAVAAALWIALLFLRQRRSHARLAQHRQRYQLALEGGNLGTWEWTTSTDHLDVDDRWHAIMGTRPSDGPPSLQALRERTHPEDWPAWKAAIDAHVRGDSDIFDAESRLRHDDGTWHWIHVRGRIIERAAPDQPQRISGTCADVTQRYAAEAAREELQLRLAKLVDQVPGTVYQYRLKPDGSSQFPYASSGIFGIYGLTPEAAATDATHVFARMHPDDRERVKASIVESARTLTAWHDEWRQIRGDGGVRWLAGTGNPQREADGSTLWHGYIHDVTEQHAATQALRHSEERLRLTAAAVKDGLWEWDTASGFITPDARCREMLGYPTQPRALPFQSWQQLAHPDDRRTLSTVLQRQIAEGAPFNVEVRLRTADNQWRWVEIRGQAAPAAEGAGTLVIGTQTDISQRRADAQLHRAVLDNAAAALLVTSADNTIELGNRRAHEYFAVDGLPLKGQSMRLICRDDAAYSDFCQSADEVRRNGTVQLEHQVPTASDTLRWFSTRGDLLDPEQPGGNLIWTLVDTTERREAEEALSTARTHLLEIIRHFPGGVLVQDLAGAAVVANQTLCDLFHVPLRAADVMGYSRAALANLVPPEVRTVLPTTNPFHDDSVAASYEIALGDARTVHIQFIPIRTPQGESLGRLWIARDVTERRRHEQTLKQLATTDALTGLANRRAFMARLEGECARQSTGGPGGMVLMLDLDHFKRVNDTWGHATGDVVLVHLARMLSGDLLRTDDLAGRLGGEEFAVLLPGTSAPEALAVGERLRRALEQSRIKACDGTTFQVTMSIGVAPLQGDAPAVLAQADAALYQAKNTGRNKVVLAQAPHAAPKKTP